MKNTLSQPWFECSESDKIHLNMHDIKYLWMKGERSHTASLPSALVMEWESSGTCGVSFTLSSTFSIQDIISSSPSWTLRERVRVTWSFSLRSLTDLHRLSYLSAMSSTDRSIFIHAKLFTCCSSCQSSAGLTKCPHCFGLILFCCSFCYFSKNKKIADHSVIIFLFSIQTHIHLT